MKIYQILMIYLATKLEFSGGTKTEEFEYPDDTPEEDINYDYQLWNGWSKEN